MALAIRAELKERGWDHGQKFLSDNGSAFNPSRRGWVGQLVQFLRSLGVVPITGKPGKPTTQGKNERAHQTLARYANEQTPAETTDELQTQVDAHDEYYNTQREHQALPPVMTPKEAWDATPPTPPDPVEDGDWHQVQRTVEPRGEVQVFGTRFMLGQRHGGKNVHAIYNTETISFFDDQGTELITHPIPPAGTRYVGNTKRRPTTIDSQVSTKS